MEINKKDIIKLLEKIALNMELKGENAFKISAYRKAAQGLERDERSLPEIDDFMKIKGIGKGTNAVIQEYITEGESRTLKALEQEVPEGLVPLLQLPGLGGKKIAKLYQELEIIDDKTLKAACERGDVEQLPGFGAKTVANIIDALSNQGNRPERIPLAVMLPVAEEIEKQLRKIPEIECFSQAGSLRRNKELVKDIDYIIATKDPVKVKEQLLTFEHMKDVVAKGETKVSITIQDVYDINVDFRLVDRNEFATALHHFTGSKDHNVQMRQLAKSRHEKISEYGVEVEETGEVLTFSSEEAFYHHFDLHFIPPEVREGTEEVIAYKEAVSLIQPNDLKGDLHMHTTWSDGAHSVEEMVEHARRRGYEYIAITDHSKYLQVANGLNETRLLRQREEIDKLNERYTDIKIFAGVEMDILPNTNLDFTTHFLKDMDIVIAAIHSSFNQSENEIMKRLYKALEHPYVDIIAHPTGRLIGRRDGYKVNMEKLLEKAKETNTALEINANPNRFDLSSDWANMAQELSIPIAINTDAHNEVMLSHMKYGVGVAKKGWLRPESVMNAWSKEKLIQFLERNK